MRSTIITFICILLLSVLFVPVFGFSACPDSNNTEIDSIIATLPAAHNEKPETSTLLVLWEYFSSAVAVFSIIAKLTPTRKDDKVVNPLIRIIDFIALNRRR